MPYYIYHCDLHKEFEVKQGIHDEPLTKCPLCFREVERVIQPLPFIMKGSSGQIDTAKFDEAYEKKVKRE